MQVRTPANWARTAAASFLLDASPMTRDWLCQYKFGPAARLHTLFRDDEAIGEWVKSSVWSGWHVSGTCRMGGDGDRMAVLDGACRVRGVDGLRVADASIMPTIVRANTNITTIAIGEKASDLILNGH